MEIRQFRYSADNFSYMLYGKADALVIDGGAVNAIISFAEAHDLEIRYVTNTHSHPDHTMGTQALLERTGATYLDNSTLLRNGIIKLEDEEIRVYHTPGHTKDSLCFRAGNALISGDTLFNGTIGNCFSGDLDAFLTSLKMLLDSPENTIVYAGHDYVRESMMFAKILEPDSREIDLFLQKYDPGHVCSTFADELRVNPYLRFNEEKMIAVLEKKRLPVGTEKERWHSLMSVG